MTPRALSSARERRTLLLGGVIVLMAWLTTRVAPKALGAYVASRERASVLVDQASRARELVHDESMLRDSLGSQGRRLVELAPRLIAGRTSAEAGATISALVSGLAATSQVRLSRIEPVTDSSAGLLVRVGVRLDAQGDIRGISRWLAMLEEGMPDLSIRSLQISATNPGGSAGQTELLRVQVGVVGWASFVAGSGQ